MKKFFEMCTHLSVDLTHGLSINLSRTASLEPFSSSLCDVQGVVSLLEEQFSPKVQAEFSVLVDVLHSPELLFPEAARLRCESGAFMSK